MAISANDLRTHLSIKTGTAGNQLAQGDPNESLGKYISTTAWVGGVLNDLFDNVTGDQNAASAVSYRCIFFSNRDASLTIASVVAWLSAETAGGANIAIGMDNLAETALGHASAQAASIATASTAPAGVTFSSPTTKGAGISVGSISPGYCRALWIRRTATNSGALDNDSVTISFAGDSPA